MFIVLFTTDCDVVTKLIRRDRFRVVEELLNAIVESVGDITGVDARNTFAL